LGLSEHNIFDAPLAQGAYHVRSHTTLKPFLTYPVYVGEKAAHRFALVLIKV
jgi:hypothetical protein